MRPISLSIEGFTSFRDRAELNFSSLDLFAIVGSTGSGKTSLIDAMIYALYGQTPRTKSASELISLGCPRLSVLFEFESGKKRYRISRVLKRGAAVTVRLEGLDNDAWMAVDGRVREIDERICRIVGLDYDGFTKAVVLPQGQFDKFLRGSTNDRREVLKSLLNVRVYDRMKQAANTRAKNFSIESTVLKDQLERDYTDATEDNRTACKSEIKELKKLDKESQKTLQNISALIEQALRLRHLRGVAAENHKLAASAQSSLAESQHQADTLRKNIEEGDARLAELSAQLAANKHDEELHQELVRLSERARQLTQLQQKRTSALHVAAQARGELETITPRLGSALHDLEAATASHQLAAGVRDEARTRLSDLKQKHGSSEVLVHVADELLALSDTETQIAEQRKKRLGLETLQQELVQKIESLESEKQVRTEAVTKSEAAYEHLTQVHASADLRAHLAAGDSCPVCEQIVVAVPTLLPTTALSDAKAALARQRTDLETTLRLLDRSVSDHRRIPQDCKAVDTGIAQLEIRITQTKAKAAKLLDQATPSSLRALAGEIQAAEAHASTADQTTRKAAEHERTCASAHTALGHQLAIINQKVDQYAQQLIEVDGDIERIQHELSGVGDVETIAGRLAAQEQAKKERDALRLNIETVRTTLSESQKKRAAAAADIAVFEERIRRGVADAAAAELESGSIEASLNGKTAALSLPEGLDEADRIQKLQQMLSAEAKETAKRLAQKEAALENLVRRIQEAEQRRERIAALDGSASVYAQLGHLLQADQFISYILQDAFNLLSAEGTRQLLELSQNRYSFDSNDSNEFFVVDHANADEKRSARTLSGGESFLASLALALALASSVSRFSEDGHAFELDALFLDEGFSTLDADTLTVAIDALQSLQEGDRMIGVISHVVDLADRLPARVQVVKGIGGSVLSVEGERKTASTALI